MQDGHIPKNMMYGEVATGHRPVGWPALRFKDICKCNLKATNNLQNWEQIAVDEYDWRQLVCVGIKKSKEHHIEHLKVRQQRKKTEQSQAITSSSPKSYVCQL